MAKAQMTSKGQITAPKEIRVPDAGKDRPTSREEHDGKADFSDYYIQCKAQKAGCTRLLTFDRTFAQSSACCKGL